MTHAGRLSVALFVLALGGCCLDGLGPPPTATPIPPPSSPGTGTGPMLPGGPAAGIGLPISFGPGAVDPIFAQGFAGGPITASTLDPSCYAGHYSTAPSHVLTVTAPLTYLRVVAYSARSTDLTLLVRAPNGIVTCNDDFDGLNPGVEIQAAGPGDYQVYVGTFSAPGPEPYELGVTTSSSLTPTTMHFATVTTVPATSAVTGVALLTGTATVTSVTGSVPGVAVGTSCIFTQTRVLPTGGPGVLDCRWLLTCGGTDLYGGTVPGGYQPCSDPSWAAGTRAMDAATTGTDTDPTFLFDGDTITIGDDPNGSHGPFTATLAAIVTPMPTTP